MCIVWTGSVLLPDQLQVLILIFLKMIMESSKNGRWIITFRKFSRLRCIKKGENSLTMLSVFFCFRWKGENVATYEVSNVLTQLDVIHDANVYGVEIPGTFII